jgi:hypothetical protein
MNYLLREQVAQVTVAQNKTKSSICIPTHATHATAHYFSLLLFLSFLTYSTHPRLPTHFPSPIHKYPWHPITRFYSAHRNALGTLSPLYIAHVQTSASWESHSHATKLQKRERSIRQKRTWSEGRGNEREVRSLLQLADVLVFLGPRDQSGSGADGCFIGEFERWGWWVGR